jgi:hypothetical protein
MFSAMIPKQPQLEISVKPSDVCKHIGIDEFEHKKVH